jgi:hypothetical protein
MKYIFRIMRKEDEFQLYLHNLRIELTKVNVPDPKQILAMLDQIERK